MAVTYMRKLEEEPVSYDSKFTALTKGVNLKVQDWILDRIGSSETILEIGCGTGTLASKMAFKGNDIVAIDKNINMINFAMKNYPTDKDVKLLYQIGTSEEYKAEDHSKDVIVSTFMLSELKTLEQQKFLRRAWQALKPNGRLILAAEFIPSGFWRQVFRIKRWWYKKKLRRLHLKTTTVVKWFFKYLEPIGFKINMHKTWKHGSIQALELLKVDVNNNNEPGYYQPQSCEQLWDSIKITIMIISVETMPENFSVEPAIPCD